MVASLTTPQPPNTGIADISVVTSDSPDGVIVGADLTYTLTVSNAGPDAATGIVFSAALPSQTTFVSASPSQGSCSHVDSAVVCKLDSLAAATEATVTVVAKPSDGGSALPPQGESISSIVFARANETDANMSNNVAAENTTILPDNNSAPSIEVTSPTQGVLLVGPATINLSATATDTNGSIDRVDFYGDGELLGSGTPAGADQYAFVWNNVTFGPHSVIALAVDNLGKTAISDRVGFMVNGLPR